MYQEKKYDLLYRLLYPEKTTQNIRLTTSSGIVRHHNPVDAWRLVQG